MNSRTLWRAVEKPTISSRIMGMAGEGLIINCFFTANGGLFERPTAAF